MTLALAEIPSATAPRLKGSAQPRIGPPAPAHSLLAEYEAAARELGIKLMPWQKVSGRQMTAIERPTGRPRKNSAFPWKYREVAIVAARQNGKTTTIIPRIKMALDRGEQVLHTAQNRDIPRKMFAHELVPLLRKLPIEYEIRMANGQEEINAPNGGRYKLVAPNASSRGETADLLIIDEVREQRDLDLMDAMLPTVIARPGGQVIYLSNAGDDNSVVLNELRRRGMEASEHRLCYLEWSAEPERDIGDREGWAEANPALGHGGLTLENLEYAFRNRPTTTFETEHLCRWVTTMLPRVVSDADWLRVRGKLGMWQRPSMGICVDPEMRRASAVIAWVEDGRMCVRLFAEAGPANPIDIDAFAEDLVKLARKERITQVGFDPWTDKMLARHFPKAEAVNGAGYQEACRLFVANIEAGRLKHDDDGTLLGDLAYTVRREVPSGWFATRSSADRPTTSTFAAIRALSLASHPGALRARVY
jgi:phage terminase large subunit-like protein